MKKVVNLCVIIEKLQNDRKEVHKEFKLSWNGSTAPRVCLKSYSSKSAIGERWDFDFNCSPIISSNSIDIFPTYINSLICPLHQKFFNILMTNHFFVLFNSLWICSNERAKIHNKLWTKKFKKESRRRRRLKGKKKLFNDFFSFHHFLVTTLKAASKSERGNTLITFY